MRFLLAFILILGSFSALGGWEDYMRPSSLGFPEPQKIGPWQWNQNYVQNDLAPDPDSFQKIGLNCPIDRLWATHPQQTTKEYVYAVWASYMDHQFSDANAIVMSDLFMDECGNSYKGFWVVPFLTREETMNTLVSIGRTIIKKPQGFPGEFIPGPTHDLASNEFLFLTFPTAEDLWKIDLSQTNARNEGYQLKQYQWVR